MIKLNEPANAICYECLNDGVVSGHDIIGNIPLFRLDAIGISYAGFIRNEYMQGMIMNTNNHYCIIKETDRIIKAVITDSQYGVEKTSTKCSEILNSKLCEITNVKLGSLVKKLDAYGVTLKRHKSTTKKKILRPTARSMRRVINR